MTPIAVLLIVGAFMAANYDVARVRYREYRERACLQQELAALDSRNARLSREVERLKTPEGVEDFARTELGLVNAGERIAVVMRDGEVLAPDSVIEEDDSAMPEGGRAAQVADGNWTAFLDTVFGLR